MRRVPPSPNSACCLLRVAESPPLDARAGCCKIASGARLVRLLLAMRLSRASVLLSKLLLWSPDIDGESGALAQAHTREVRLGNVELAKRGENRDIHGQSRHCTRDVTASPHERCRPFERLVGGQVEGR